MARAASLAPGPTSPWDGAVGTPPLARWDSVWYHRIATEGFSYDPKQSENSVGFYPLYPLAVRWLAAVLGTPILWTGIGLSLLCLLGALEMIGDLFARVAGETTALWGIAALLLFPTSFFFAAIYTESLFLLTTAGALRAASGRRWLLAGLCAGLAALTRFNGFVIGVPLAWRLWEERRAPGRFRAVVACLGPLVLGAALFPLYLWRRFGDPLLYLHSKAQGWGKQGASPWTLVTRVARGLWQRALDPSAEYRLNLFLEASCALIFLVLTVALFRRRRIAEGLYTAAALLLVWSSASLDGMPRFVLVLFPAFLPVGEVLRRRKPLALAYAAGGIALAAVLLYRFVHWTIVA